MNLTLTVGQLRKLVEAVGGLKDFPQHTEDPQVNHAIDCIVVDEGEEPEYDETYADEIASFKDLAKSRQSA